MATTKYWMMKPSMTCPRCGDGMYPREQELHEVTDHYFWCRNCDYRTPRWEICTDPKDALEHWKKYVENPMVIFFWHRYMNILDILYYSLRFLFDNGERAVGWVKRKAGEAKHAVMRYVMAWKEKVTVTARAVAKYRGGKA